MTGGLFDRDCGFVFWLHKVVKGNEADFADNIRSQQLVEGTKVPKARQGGAGESCSVGVRQYAQSGWQAASGRRGQKQVEDAIYLISDGARYNEALRHRRPVLSRGCGVVPAPIGPCYTYDSLSGWTQSSTRSRAVE